jgi:HEAT repeat protein
VDIIRKSSQRSDGATDLGSVSARDAVDFLLHAARTGGSGKGAEEAVFPATLADVQDIWRDLLGLARDRALHEDVRTAAVFWVGQEAADAATEGLAQMAMDRDEEQEVRDAAVFALSQRPDDEALPLLMEIARTAPGAETRRSAMFWLAESEDERALEFFEEILLRRGRGGG